MPSESNDTRQLLARARNGDANALTQIVTDHQEVVRRYVARLAPDPETADDMAQEVFLAALESLDRIDPERGIRPYLMGIARNHCRSAWRSKCKGREVSGHAVFDLLAARTESQPEAASRSARSEILRDCIQRLPDRMVSVLERFYRLEESCDDIARQMGLKTSSIRSTLTRSRQSLLDCIQSRMPEALQ